MSYVNQVAEHFLSINPEISLLAPEDYLRIAEWEKQRIPVEIVVNGMNAARLAGATLGENCSIESSRYFVRQTFELWLNRSSGGEEYRWAP